MKALTSGMALAAALLLALVPAVAQPKADCPPQPSASPGATAPPASPEKIEGTVTDIDGKSNLVTLRAQNGQVHQFRGNPETIKDLKVGDRLELNRRAAQNC